MKYIKEEPEMKKYIEADPKEMDGPMINVKILYPDHKKGYMWLREIEPSTPGTTEGKVAYIEMDPKVLPEDSSDVFVMVGKEKLVGCYEGDGWWTDTYGPRTEITSWLKSISPSKQIGEVSEEEAKRRYEAADTYLTDNPIKAGRIKKALQIAAGLSLSKLTKTQE